MLTSWKDVSRLRGNLAAIAVSGLFAISLSSSASAEESDAGESISIDNVLVDQATTPIRLTIEGSNLGGDDSLQIWLDTVPLSVMTRSNEKVVTEWPESETVIGGSYQLTVIRDAPGGGEAEAAFDGVEIAGSETAVESRSVYTMSDEDQATQGIASPLADGTKGDNSLSTTSDSSVTRRAGDLLVPTEEVTARGGDPLSRLGQRLNSSSQPGTLRGFVDLHTHPMAHLGFGGHVVHGAPDVGILMPVGSIYNPSGVGLSGETCNRHAIPAKSLSMALGTCYSTHGGHDLMLNKCGNHVRRIILEKMESDQHLNKPHAWGNVGKVSHPQGYPNFSHWPRNDDTFHQLMWVDWLKRAKDGGMRVLVALAVNNSTLARGIEANAPLYDKQSGDIQISQIKRFVQQRSTWMQIAYTPAELRDIVGRQDKLAVVIGWELDDLGDFMRRQTPPSPGAIRSEIQRLHRIGVRYIFPVHVTDNYFGGTAVYDESFQIANAMQFGHWWDLECSREKRVEETISRDFTTAAAVMKTNLSRGLRLLASQPPIPNCDTGGHANKRGLTAEGRIAIDEMMRQGMMIDIDHASRKTVDAIFTHTAKIGYPLVSGHNGLLGSSRYARNENNRTEEDYEKIAARGGMAGVGWGSQSKTKAGDALTWLDSVTKVRNTGVAVALGSDINGLVKQPPSRPVCQKQPCVIYDASFPQSRLGKKTWDYNRDGVAHIGLFPDFLRDVQRQQGGREIVNQVFDGAESFAVMWENALKAGKSVEPVKNPGLTVLSADYGANCGLPHSKRNITEYVQSQCDGRQFCPQFVLDWRPWRGRDPSPSMCKKQFQLKWKCPNGRTYSQSVFHQMTPQPMPFGCK